MDYNLFSILNSTSKYSANALFLKKKSLFSCFVLFFFFERACRFPSSKWTLNKNKLDMALMMNKNVLSLYKICSVDDSMTH